MGPLKQSKIPGIKATIVIVAGKQMYPFLVDENTGVRMNESTEINAYLWKTYGSEEGEKGRCR